MGWKSLQRQLMHVDEEVVGALPDCEVFVWKGHRKASRSGNPKSTAFLRAVQRA